MRRKPWSMQPIVIANVPSQTGISTRKREHASHAQNSNVTLRATVGPQPPVELQPAARFRDPRAIHPPTARLPRLLGLGHRPAGSLIGPGEAHRHELVVHRIGTDAALPSALRAPRHPCMGVTA